MGVRSILTSHYGRLHSLSDSLKGSIDGNAAIFYLGYLSPDDCEKKNVALTVHFYREDQGVSCVFYRISILVHRRLTTYNL